MWPQILLPKGDTKIKAPKGVKGLGTIHVAGGRLQLAINGEALYRFQSTVVTHDDASSPPAGKPAASPAVQIVPGGLAGQLALQF